MRFMVRLSITVRDNFSLVSTKVRQVPILEHVITFGMATSTVATALLLKAFLQ